MDLKRNAAELTADLPQLDRPFSVCLFCGSSNNADSAYLDAAEQFGRQLAQGGVRLVYGGGGVGLMGRAAKAANASGGKVLGIIPEFLRTREVVYDDVETVVVPNMHERKRQMFEESDAFAIFPGGVGTLEEVVELISWRRLELHRKPIVFADIGGFWQPFFDLIRHTIDHNVTPNWVPSTWGVATKAEDVLPVIMSMLPTSPGPSATVLDRA